MIEKGTKERSWRRDLDDDSVIKKLDPNGDVYYCYLALGPN